MTNKENQKLEEELDELMPEFGLSKKSLLKFIQQNYIRRSKLCDKCKKHE